LRNEAEVALRAPRSSAEYRDVLRSQLEEIERLTRLADQLLFLCREDAGRPPPAAPVRLDPLLATLSEQMQPVAQARGLSLRVEDIPDGVVDVDADRLQRLFANLLDNALKYTPPGGGIWVSGRRDNGSIEIAVSDNGIGVPAEHQSRLFERFYRADPARRGCPGAGLGLAICRSIVQRHGGTIRLQSAPGRGTTVRVTLPASSSAQTPTGP
jgi:signal transduction histidine kinase